MFIEKEMDRIAITIPKDFLVDLDKSCDARNTNRSEVVRDALREFLKKDTTLQPDTFEDGFLIIAFNHHQKGLLDELTEIEHNAGIHIYSTMHIHVSEKNCSEVIAFHGDVKNVITFVEQVKALKGILFCEIVPLYTFTPANGERANANCKA